MKKKILLYIMAMVLLFTVVAGATFAYLFAEGDAVENVFTPALIGTPKVAEGTLDLTIIPGAKITKDPTIQYTPDSAGDDVDYVLLYAVLDLKPDTSEWLRSGDKFTFTSTKTAEDGSTTDDTIDFSVYSNNWLYVGTTKAGNYIYVYKKVLAGDTSSSKFQLFTGNVVNVSTGWTEDEIDEVFTDSKVQIKVGSYAAQAKPWYNATATISDKAIPLEIWNACSNDDI